MPGSDFLLRRALIQAPFVVLASVLFLASAHAQCTPPTEPDSRATVKHVYDGDTVLLTDGRKVRFIGLNTPERGKDGQADDPYYRAASERLLALLKSQQMQILLQHGKEPADRYQRLLAHPYLADGTSLTEKLLEEGYGFQVIIPPNLTHIECYQAAEKRARDNSRLVWSHTYFSPRTTTTVVDQQLGGFQFITGKIVRVGESHDAWWLNLHDRLAVQIKKQDLLYFPYAPKSLLGKQITARGWISNRHGRMKMTISHPAALEIND